MRWRQIRNHRALPPLFITLAITFQTPARGDHPAPAVPANARPLPGQTEYPLIGRSQKTAIVTEAIGSTLGEVTHRPLRSLLKIVGRSSERLGVRGRELTSRLGSARPLVHLGNAGDGNLDARRGSPPMPALLTLLPSSEAAVQGLLALIQGAKDRVDLMIYGWEDDPTGREVAAALETAARRGVAVRLLVDRGGWLIHNAAAASRLPTFLDRLGTIPGVSVIEPDDAFLRFDHRKLAVIDGRIAWTGGMILTEVARRSWENLAFLAEGPVVSQYAAVFEDRWREAGGLPAGPVVADPPVSLPNSHVRMIRTDTNDRSLKETIYHAIDHASHHIYLENPYFSDTIMAEKLIAASRRGVDVRVVVTLRGNVPRLNQYVSLTANRLWKGGVRVFLAPGMTHVKAMTVDGVWAYLGTGNFDELSLRNNREVGLSVISPAIVSTLDQTLFLADMARAEELTAPMPWPMNWLKLELLKLWF